MSESAPSEDQPPGPRRERRVATEPDWLCDGAFLDELGRLWHCGRTKHPLEQRHQASLYTTADGSGGEVDWRHHREWFDR